MKLFLIYFFSLALSINIMAQSYESQPYKVLEKKDKIEIRYYPRSAKVRTSSEYGSNNNFRKLFRYISGNNTENEKIAMTTPVYMSIDKKTMEFVLPNKYVKDSLILPKGDQVESYFSDPVHIASIRYSGYSNYKTELQHTNTLLESLNNLNIKTKGDPYVLVYNGPYKFFNRRNEIHIEIQYE